VNFGKITVGKSAFLLWAYINPDPANVENMVSS